MSVTGAVSYIRAGENAVNDQDSMGIMGSEASEMDKYLSQHWSRLSKAPQPKARTPDHYDIHHPPQTHFDPYRRPDPRSLRNQNAKTPSLSKIERSLSILNSTPSIYTYKSFDATVLQDMLVKHEYWNRSRHRLIFVHGQAGHLADSPHITTVQGSKDTPTMAQVVLHDSRLALVGRLRGLRREGKIEERRDWRDRQLKLGRAEEAIDRMWTVIEEYKTSSLR